MPEERWRDDLWVDDGRGWCWLEDEGWLDDSLPPAGADDLERVVETEELIGGDGVEGDGRVR
jgi:hypothetical protein